MPLTDDDLRERIERRRVARELRSNAATAGQNTSALGDFGTDLKRGGWAIPGALTGIADIPFAAVTGTTPFDTATDYIGEAIGFQPERFAEEAISEYSPARQASDARVAEAEGFLDTFTETLANPRSLAGVVAESLPTMVAGGGIGKGLSLAAKGLAPAVAVGAGEGAISAGLQMESLTDQGADPRTAALASAATGAVIGAIGVGGATLAQKMKIADPDLIVAGLGNTGRVSTAATKLGKATEMGKRVGLGALQEGVVEEMPQSMAETILANAALGKDLTEGLGESAASGLLAGGVMGGGFNIKGAKQPQAPAEETVQSIQAAIAREATGLAERDAGELTAMAASFNQRVEDIINLKRNSVGGKRAERLRAMLATEDVTVQDIEDAIKGLPKETVQEQIRRDPYYKHLQAQEEAATAAVAVPEAEVGAEVVAPGPDRPVVAEKDELTPEGTRARDAILKKLDIELIDETPASQQEPEGVDELTPIEGAGVDTGTRAAKEPAPATDAKLDEPAKDNTTGITKRGIRGLASLINGFTTENTEKANISAQSKAGKDIKSRFKEMKTALGKFYTKTGAPRADTPADLKAFLKDMPGIAETYGNDGRVLAGIRKRGATLAKKYKTPELERQVNRLTHGYELQKRAKAVRPVSQESQLNLQRMKDLTFNADTEATPENIDTLFADLHGLIAMYDKKIQSVSSDPKNVPTDTDTIPPLGEQGAAQAGQGDQAAAAIAHALGRGPANGANIFALEEAIASQFAKLESVVGRKTLLQAMGESKKKTTKTRKALPGVKSGEESSAGILFSSLYGNFRAHGAIDPRPSRMPVRFVNEKQKRLENSYVDKNGKKIPYKPVVIKGDGTVSRQEGQPESRMEEKLTSRRKHRKGKQAPVMLLLDTLAGPSMSPVSRLLAKRFLRIMERSGYLNNIDLILHPEELSPNNAAGMFSPATADADGNLTQPATIQLWTMGTRETTVLHEVMHAITVGITSQWKNDPTSVTKAQAGALKSLEAMRGDVVKALQGQKKNTGKDLGGTLDHLLDILADSNVGLDEFMTYALTDNDLQNWMKDHPALARHKMGKSIKNWWQTFTAKFKLLLGLHNLSDEQAGSVLETFADSTGTLIGAISSSATAKRGMSVFFFEPTATPQAEELTAVVDKIIATGERVGTKTASRLRRMVSSTAINSKKGMDDAMKGMSKKIKDVIHATDQYKNAPEEAVGTEDRPAFAQIADPSKPWTGTSSSVTATEGVQKDAVNKETHRATVAEGTAQAQEEALTEEKVEAEKVKERNRLKQATTSVKQHSKGKRIGPRNATIFDKAGRAIADGVIAFVSAGKYKNYEAFAKDMLAKYGGNIANYTAQDKFMAQSLGRFLSKTVDSYGVPAAYRNMMGAFEGAFRGKFNDAYSTYENLMSLTAQQQQGLLDFLYNGNEKALKEYIPNEKQHSNILATAKELNEMLVSAKAEGMVDPKDMDKTVGDFINLKEGAFRVINSVSYSQITPPSGADNNVTFAASGDGKTSFVPRDQVIGKDGKPVDVAKGMSFHMAATGNGQGDLYAIEVGADMSVWNDFGVAPIQDENGNPADPLPFLVSNPRTTNEEFTFYRKVTVAERHKEAREKLDKNVFEGSEKARAHVVSGLTRLAQEWGRNIQGREIISGMVKDNERMEDPSARWITDGKPEDVAANRVTKITDEGEAQKSKAIRSKLRIPGNWAYIEDNPANRKLFGDIAGKHVAGPVYSSLLDYNDTTPLINSATFRTTLTLWKQGKTVFSPVAHVNNISGNVVLAYYYDLPAENIMKAFEVVKYEMLSEAGKKKHPLNSDQEALRQEMHDMGITLAQAKSADFDVASQVSLSGAVEAAAARTGVRGLVDVFQYMEAVSSKASDMYSNQDNVFRLAMYMTHIQDNADIGAGGMVGADVKAAAALAAERAFVDYRIHAPWIKAARESVLPFIAWPYRMFPMLMKVLITKPWKAGTTMMAIYSLNSMAYAMLGADGDDEEAERSLLPEWHKQGIAWMPGVPSNIRLPIGTGDNAYFWNISRAVTLADMDEMSGSGIPSMLMPGGPAAIMAYAAAGFDPFTGKELSDGTEDLGGFVKSRAEYLTRGLAPGAVTSIITAAKHQGTTGPLGYDHSFWVDAAKILGISSFQLNKPEAAFYQDVGRKQIKRKFSAAQARMWRNELRNKDPDYAYGVQQEIEFQQRMTLELQALAEG